MVDIIVLEMKLWVALLSTRIRKGTPFTNPRSFIVQGCHCLLLINPKYPIILTHLALLLSIFINYQKLEMVIWTLMVSGIKRTTTFETQPLLSVFQQFLVWKMTHHILVCPLFQSSCLGLLCLLSCISLLSRVGFHSLLLMRPIAFGPNE